MKSHRSLSYFSNHSQVIRSSLTPPCILLLLLIFRRSILKRPRFWFCFTGRPSPGGRPPPKIIEFYGNGPSKIIPAVSLLLNSKPCLNKDCHQFGAEKCQNALSGSGICILRPDLIAYSADPAADSADPGIRRPNFLRKYVYLYRNTWFPSKLCAKCKD